MEAVSITLTEEELEYLTWCFDEIGRAVYSATKKEKKRIESLRDDLEYKLTDAAEYMRQREKLHGNN